MTYGEAGTARSAIGSGLINYGVPKVNAKSQLQGYYLIILFFTGHHLTIYLRDIFLGLRHWVVFY